MLVISSPRFGAHVTPPGHPERVERAHAFDGVASRWAGRGGQVSAPRPASVDEIARVHDIAYVEALAASEGRAVMLDPDTFTSPESYRIALLAAGAAIQAAVHAVDAREPAIALVRPPGHHAERDRAMGFCLFNNVAVAAAATLARGLTRIAIVDIDVHHGNGTQNAFYDDSRVLYVSTHQHPFYPGTGAAEEVGTGEGRGFTVNVPMEAGSGDRDYQVVYDDIILPVLDVYAPQLLLVSAGFDAHERDPLASMHVTTEGYADLVDSLARVARRHGALALVTEGGYHLASLSACLDAAIAAVDAAEPQPVPSGVTGTGKGARAAERARRALQEYWPVLSRPPSASDRF
jgi:acetoin utilization deacetylase AcuC-like enzyme